MVAFFCIGARVLCSLNLCSECSLVNGAIGTVVDMVWKECAEPKEEDPHVLMVHFPGYSGPKVYFDDEGRVIVPIFRSERPYTYHNDYCTLTQFPLFIAFAISVHKSQGTTQDKVWLDIADKEFTPGLTYVAISRVKTLDGVMFESPFGLHHLRRPAGDVQAARMTDWTRRNGQILQPLVAAQPDVDMQLEEEGGQ